MGSSIKELMEFIYKDKQGFQFLAGERLKQYFFSGTARLPLTGSSKVILPFLSHSTANSRCEVPALSFIEQQRQS